MSQTSCSPSTAERIDGRRSRVRIDCGAGAAAPVASDLRDRAGGVVPRAAGAIRAALQLSRDRDARARARRSRAGGPRARGGQDPRAAARRSEEHTSELQSQSNLVCRLLLEKKKQTQTRVCTRAFSPRLRLTSRLTTTCSLQ